MASSHARPVSHRSTGSLVEHDFLGALPRVRFDSDYVEVRRVHNVLPFVSIDANRYSVPPEALGHKVEIRRKVNGVNVEIRLAGRLIATHRLVAGRRVDVWNPEHRAAAEALALGWNTDRPDLRLIADHDEPAESSSGSSSAATTTSPNPISTTATPSPSTTGRCRHEPLRADQS